MNISIKRLLVSFFAVVVAIVPTAIFAQGNNVERSVVVSQDQVINHDYFAAGNSVTMGGTVNGDAYIAGGQVDVTGTINGDLLVAGGQVTVTGTVTQNIRAVGGTILIKGNVKKNISIVGGNLFIDSDAVISGNAVVVGGNSQILTRVKDLTLVGGSVMIKSDVLGNVIAAIGKLDMSSSTIHGNVDYWSSEAANLTSSATVEGTTTFHATQPAPSVSKVSEQFARAGLLFSLFSFISLGIIGLILVFMVPVYSQKTSELVVERFWQNFLIGIVAVIVTPIFIGLLVVTWVGVPIAIALLFGYIAILYISKLFVLLALGMFVSRKAAWKVGPAWALIIGLVLYYVIGFIPIIGALVKIVVGLVGVGAVVSQKRNYYTMLRSKKII
ncbi:MAG TPA: hypothetical protein VLG69_03820 [Candidatus Andersenbacteria bacterium]|nr:hypothetical protein [Candidatus Andersenbacteria bacterium]